MSPPPRRPTGPRRAVFVSASEKRRLAAKRERAVRERARRAAFEAELNRHERQRAAAMEQQNKFYDGYIKHLPQVAVDAPLERGRLYHLTFFHDDWCTIFDGADCNCDPIVTRHIEPRRS